MKETKTNRVISFGVITLIFIMIFFGLFNRFVYEGRSKKIYMSANYDDISSYGGDVGENLAVLKNAGVNFVTLKPVFLSDLTAEKKVDIVTYSSLKINEDEGSRAIFEALGDGNYDDESMVIISSDIPTTDFLKNNLSVRYKDVTQKQVYENVTVFLVDKKTRDDDLILGYDTSEIQKAKESNMKIAVGYPSYTFESEEYGDYFASFILLNDVDFIILENYDGDNKISPDNEFLKKMSKVKASLVVFENENQVRNVQPFVYGEWKPAFNGRILRGFNTDKIVEYDKTDYRYRYYQWYNSATERNTTFINVNILKNTERDFEENLKLTAAAVSDFKNLAQKQGYAFEDDYFYEEYPDNMKLFAICGGALIAVLVLLYLSLLGIEIPNCDIVGCVFVLAMIISSFAFYDYVTRYYACILSILITGIFTLLLFKFVASERKYGAFGAVAMFFGFVFFGSFVISAMLGDFEFFVGEKWVFGVKLTLTVPFLTTAYNYNAVFLKIKSVKELREKIKEETKKIPLYALIIAGVVFVFAIAYFLIRTGKSSLILPAEDMMRKKLTDIFAVRPRTKEFLIGYPLFSLFLYFSFYRKNKKGRFLCGIFQTLLFTSVLNTFSHAFTRYFTSLRRFFNGLFLGIIVSGVIIGIVELVIFAKKKIENSQNKTEKTVKNRENKISIKLGLFEKIKAFCEKKNKKTKEKGENTKTAKVKQTKEEKLQKTEKSEKTKEEKTKKETQNSPKTKAPKSAEAKTQKQPQKNKPQKKKKKKKKK